MCIIGSCTYCVHERVSAFEEPCRGCRDIISKPEWEPKPEFVLSDEGEIPNCFGCKYYERPRLHLECKYCTGLSCTPVGNFFEPKEVVNPVTKEESKMSKRAVAVIENAWQLMQAGTLQADDIVLFGDLEYVVRDSYLNNPHGFNVKIFERLELYKYAVASTAYGYRSYGGDWPEFRARDYAAATRLVYMLYALIDSKQVEEHAAKVERLRELRRMLESYQQDEDDALVALEEAQRDYNCEKQSRVALEADIDSLEKELGMEHSQVL